MSADPADPDDGTPVVRAADHGLVLQQMERALVRAAVAEPEVLAPDRLARVRYLIAFARLGVWEPAAAPSRSIDLREELDPFRRWVVARMAGPLRGERTATRRLRAAWEAYLDLASTLAHERRLVLERHGHHLAEAELDAEVGRRTLALVMGGGGGSAYVYLGAVQALREAGIDPGYVIGSSVGALQGALLARELPVPLEQYVDLARGLVTADLVARDDRPRRHGLPGLRALQLDRTFASLFTRDGRSMLMRETEIPLDVVVAGLRRQSVVRPEAPPADAAGLRLPRPLGPPVATARRLWQAAAYVDPRIVRPLVLGDGPFSRDLPVLDAVSFSSAIPGVLHHETLDPRASEVLDGLLEAREVTALLDGSAVSNVPAEQAWLKVQQGRLRTRNVAVLALDCFHPGRDPRQMWLTPVTRAVGLQMVRNQPYCDHLLRMAPSPSPFALAPGPAAVDRAVAWGRASMEQALPVVRALLAPVGWQDAASEHHFR